jgi:hypothetical protein
LLIEAQKNFQYFSGGKLHPVQTEIMRGLAYNYFSKGDLGDIFEIYSLEIYL